MRIPDGIACAQDYERLGRAALPAPLAAWLRGGSGHDRTVALNRQAFASWAVLPRVGLDLRHGHTRCRWPRAEVAPEQLRLDLPHPIAVAAAAHQGLLHPQAECASAQGADAADALLVLSTLSSQPLQAVAAAAPGPKWFQLYLQPRRAASLALLRRAEAAGYRALVLTLDAQLQLPSHAALRAGFRLPPEARTPNLDGLPDAPAPGQAATGSHAEPPARPLPPGTAPCPVFQQAMAAAPRLADLDWLLGQTRLPVWVKGVLHPEDARAIAQRPVAGLIVSNHGGRSLDGAPAALQMLPAIRQAVGAELPLLLDSGVRSGGDVFKALALGAQAVLVGRLPLYGLALAGALGVAHVLRLLREELALTMALAGCATLDEIGPHCLVPLPPPAARIDDDDGGPA